mgnify:CR=1 FL=1
MSNLYEQIEEEESKLKDESTDEPKVEPEEEVDAADEEEAESKEEVEEESEEDEEEEEKEPEKEEEQKLDASAYAKLRREKRELQERVAAMEAEKAPVVEVATDAEPSKEDSYEEWLEWKNDKLEKRQDKIEEQQAKDSRDKQQNELWSGAVKEFKGFEREFQKKTPDYEAAADHMRERLTDAILLTNPNATQQEVSTQVSNFILKSASVAAQDGYNPAESLYRQAKERFGFTAPVAESSAAPKKQTNLKKIDSNRRKSASPLQSGGATNSNHVSLESINSMSMAEFARLTPSQIRELEGQ